MVTIREFLGLCGIAGMFEHFMVSGTVITPNQQYCHGMFGLILVFVGYQHILRSFKGGMSNAEEKFTIIL